MKYDVDYFINKFEAIPEEKWSRGFTVGRAKCALGHCSGYEGEESMALGRILLDFSPYKTRPISFRKITNVHGINDGYAEYQELGANPKERILVALWNVKLSGVIK